MANNKQVIIIGAGPAGLSSAYELVRCGYQPIVLERGERAGGISRTEQYGDFRFDLGGHRFYTKMPAINELWESMLGDELLSVRRMSRIIYGGKFYHYPLEVREIPFKLGFVRSLRVLGSYLRAHVAPVRPEVSFEDWVSNRFGRYLFEIFFKTYSEKMWGIPCTQISAEWAAQRIRGLSFVTAVRDSLFNRADLKTLAREFRYPRLGPGMMWERFARAIEAGGGRVMYGVNVDGLELSAGRVNAVLAVQGGQRLRLPADQVISSMALRDLVLQIRADLPPDVERAARALTYRDFILVGLVVRCSRMFADQWIYVHEPHVKVGRIQNFKNWSADICPDPERTCLGFEYFCNEGDEIWNLADADLVRLAGDEMQRLGLAAAEWVEGGRVIRQEKAYPVYNEAYPAATACLRRYLAEIPNLQTIGRNGIHRYNNQDHSMLMGLLAARNLMGEEHDLWQVNTESDYLEG